MAKPRSSSTRAKKRPAPGKLPAAGKNKKLKVGLVGFGGFLSWLVPTSGTRQLYAIVEALLTSQVSGLAAQVVPWLLIALRHAHLSAAERRATSVLRGWSHQLVAGSAAAIKPPKVPNAAMLKQEYGGQSITFVGDNAVGSIRRSSAGWGNSAARRWPRAPRSGTSSARRPATST